MPFDLAARIEAWRTQLLDTTKRNRLINFRTGRSGGIALVYPDCGELWHRLVVDSGELTFPWKRDLIDVPDEEAAEADLDTRRTLACYDPNEADPDESPSFAAGQDILERCRSSPRLHPDHLLTELPDRQLAARLTRLHLNAREALTEQGIAILYLAFGFLRWYESPESQAEIYSPLVLVPVRLERDNVEAPWRLQAEDEEILPNHSLAQLVSGDFKLRLPALDDQGSDLDDPAWRTRYFGAVQHGIRHQPRWEVLDEAALGTFNFQKLAMWEDLGRNLQHIQNHDLCRAIAGDYSIVFSAPADIPGSEELDERVLPQQTHHILDADSSQHSAIVAAMRGVNLVLDGPPGTGKSQTIANLISESLAAGRTVLFVSEKAAALEVVKRRLDEHGLGDFCLALHSHKANKREVIGELGRCLSLIAEDPRGLSDDLQQLFQVRRQLNEYARELHRVRLPLGQSAFQVHGELARLAGLTSTSRCPIPQILQRDDAYLREVTDLLARLPDCRSVIEGRGHHPWHGCKTVVYSLTLRDDVRYHFGRLADCFRRAAEAAPLLAEFGLQVAALTRDSWLTALAQARRVLACPPVPASWFEHEPRSVAQAVIQLNEVTRKYRQLRDTLPEFNSETLRSVDPASWAGPLAADGRHARLLPKNEDSVRARRQRLAHASLDLRELLCRLVTTEEAVQQVLGILQVPIPSPAVNVLGRFAELAAHIAAMRPVRRSWWDLARRRELRCIAARCHEEARAAEQLRIELTGRFAPQAFAPESAPLAAQAGQLLSQLPQVADTLPESCQWFDRAGSALRELLGQTAQVDQAVQRVLTLLRVRVGAVPLASLRRLAALADQASCMRLVPKSWWDPARREELRGIITRFLRETQAAQALRIELMTRLSPQAFAAENASLTAESLRFGSYLSRLLPRWWSFESKVSGWYTQECPKVASLLDDLRQLAVYHRRADYCRQVQTQFTAEVLRTEEGEPDWDGTLEGLNSVDRLIALGMVLPTLQKTLSAEGDLDRNALAFAAVMLGQHEKSLLEHLDLVRHEYGLDPPTDEPAGAAPYTLWDLRTWVEAQIGAVDQKTAFLHRVRGLLANDQDAVTRDALLDDLGRLAAYQGRADYCRQVQVRYAADLLWDGEGRPDWAGTLESLAALDRLEQFAKIPLALQTVLSTDGDLDRAALAVAAERLSEEVGRLREQLKTVGQDYDLGEVTDADPRRIRLNPADFRAWLETQVTVVDRELTFLDRICALLRANHDLALQAAPAKIRAATELAALRDQADCLRDRIWKEAPPEAVEDHDWSPLAECAGKLIRFLDAWDGPLPPPVIRGLTVLEVRSRLEEAVRRNNTACDEGFDDSWEFLTGLFDTSQEVSTGIVINGASLADLHVWLVARAGDAHRIQEWTQFSEIRREMSQLAVLPLLAEAFDGVVQLPDASDAFRARFLRLWLDALYAQVPALRQFRTESHERLIERFRTLDRRSVESGGARLRHLLLSRPGRPRAISAEAPASSELGKLLREVNKKRRYLPLRKLFAQTPTLLPRLKPCLMMSPLAVSTYLQSPDFRFDLVIFDEASQVRPHDAICAIYRGRQLLVAGDQKQLPPTSFFERSLDADDEPAGDDPEASAGLSDFESVLDVCCTLGLARRRLRWHYRSQRESLIAFSNHYFYADDLVTFPSVHDTDSNQAVAFEYVADGRWKPGSGGGFNAVEAARTAERVMEHFREYPEQSLGVIAFSQRQQLRVLDELERLRRANPELEEFFREDRRDPFFVKNLENVQGDERDVIFLSVGYGPDETGRVAMRFGPLNRAGGERRLNVAVTRARRAMRVVSSLRAQDLDLSRTGAVGVRLLRAYLDFAERGPAALRSAITEDSARDFDSPFEREVFDELTRHGLSVHPQVGCGGFRVDMAVIHPREPGRYLLGVECDGATYHSSATARDRDRLRQEVLESLGWRICRIWSTDWLRDRDGQVQRVLSALEKAQQEEPGSAPAPKVANPQGQAQPARAVQSEASVPEAATAAYVSIDEVPDGVLRDSILEMLQSYGATNAGDLVQSVARRLGFRRTGKRIQAWIGETTEELIRSGKISRIADQRLQLAQPFRVVNG